MFYLFPFGILIPALFIFLILRFGIKFFNDFMRNNRLSPRERRQLNEGSWLQSGFGSFGGFRSDNIEALIFRAADKHSGRLTISDIVLETSLSMKEAEEVINGMVDGLHVRMEVKDNGMVIYEFPEIIARFEEK